MLAALHPRYLRLLVDWAALQPSPSHPAALNAPVDGCARGVPPCGSYPGVEGELAAIASARRSAVSGGAPPPEVAIDILGAPAWAALPAHGCEAPGAASAARALEPDALGAYRALIGGLVSLARRERVPLAWLSPWNEPNNPRFLSPQRASCGAAGAPLAADAYAGLARAASAQLRESGSGAQLLLGELGGYDSGSPHRLSVAQFIGALPADVLCLGHDWSVHAYASYGRHARTGADPVGELERALDARGGCAAGARIWVTEAGAGAPRPGRPRRGGRGEEAAGCSALAAQLEAWSRDPRVAAVMQYSFREDPAYPVGLLDAGLAHVYPTYGLWSAWAAGSHEPAGACRA
jgi:hypothetical protein